MKHLFVEQTYQRVDLERFEETFFSEAFNDLIRDQVGMRERVLEQRTELGDGRVELLTRWVSKFQLPKMLAKLAKTSEVGYHERSVWDPAAHTLRYKIEHPYAKHVQIQGSIRFEPLDGGVRQVLEGEVQVNVRGVRGLIEKLIESELHKAYQRKQGLMQGYLDEHA